MPMNIYEPQELKTMLRFTCIITQKLIKKRKILLRIITCFLSMNPSNKNVDSFSNS